MPNIVTGSNTTGRHTSDLRNVESQGYDYPDGLNLRPGFEFHDKLRDRLTEMARESWRIMQHRHSAWREVDNSLTAFINIDQDELDVKAADERKPVSLVVPATYAQLDVLLTFMVESFLELPYFRYQGSGPEDVEGALLLEYLVKTQNIKSKMGLNLYVMWRDAIAYGIGPMAIGWEKIKGSRSTFENGSRRKKKVTKFEGNKAHNIDPYLFLPDPNTPIHEIQQAEYVGWIDRSNRISLLREETQSEGARFNSRYLKFIEDRTTTYTSELDRAQSRSDKTSKKKQTDGLRHTSPVDTIHFYIDLIPKDWDLGNKETPEKWYFEIASEEIILQAQPVGLDHDMFPVVVFAPEFDGHSISPISKLELVAPMQGAIDFLYNAHMQNLRKAVNDMWVIDPQLVNYFDVANPKPGKIIRMRRSAWGRGVKDAIAQFPVNDVTRGNVQDALFTLQLLEKTTGGTDALQGTRRTSSERVTATEVQGDRSAGFSRLARSAKVGAMQAHYDAALMIGSNTQQLMEEDQWVRVLGDHIESINESLGTNGELLVNPAMIDVDYDVLPNEGAIVKGQFADSWINILQIIAQQPEIAAQFDMFKIVSYISKLLGATNIDNFRAPQINAQILPTEQVQAAAQAGNLQPVGGI